VTERVPLTRAETLALLDESRRELLRAAERRGWDAVDANGWTTADHVAHLVAWQRRLIAWFAEHAAGRAPVRPERGYTFDQIDALNARDYERARERPREAIVSDFQEAHLAITRIVEWLTDDDLAAPDRFAWLGFPASHTIAGNSFGHYLEHIAMFEQDA
jgi:hypothetical protein